MDSDGNKKARLCPRFFVASMRTQEATFAVRAHKKNRGQQTPVSHQPECC
jgi:hypothetical protein